MTLDEINELCGDAVSEFLATLDSSAETKLTTGHTLVCDEDNSEWSWVKGGFAGPSSEFLYLEATRLSCVMEDVTKQSVLDALNSLVVK